MTTRHGRRTFLRATVAGAVALTGCAGVSPPAAEERTATGPSGPPDETASAMFRGGVRNLGYHPDAVVPDAVTEDWHIDGVNVGDHTAAKASAVLDPDGRYLVPGDSGDVLSVTPDATVVWTASTDSSGRGVHGTPAVANGLCYVGAYDGALYAFDLDTGKRVWKASLGDAIGSSPVYHDGTLYIAVEFDDPSGAVFAVDPLSGEVTWRDDRPTDHPHSTIGIDPSAGRLTVGANDGVLYGWSYPDLERAWTFETGGPIKGPIAVHDGAAFFGSWDESIYRVGLRDGREEWRFETTADVMSAPAIDTDEGVVYVGGHDTKLHALEVATGDERWSYDTGGWIIGAATATREHVLAGSYDGRLHAVEAATGDRAWAAAADGHVSSDPLVTDSAVVFTERATTDHSGRLFRFVAAD